MTGIRYSEVIYSRDRVEKQIGIRRMIIIPLDLFYISLPNTEYRKFWPTAT